MLSRPPSCPLAARGVQLYCAIRCIFEDDDDDSHRLVNLKPQAIVPAKENTKTTQELIDEYNTLAQRIQQQGVDIQSLGGGAPKLVTTSLAGSSGLGPATSAANGARAACPKPRVRWLPLRRGAKGGGGSYMRAAGTEEQGCCAPRYAIGGGSSEEGSEVSEPAGNGSSYSGQPISVSVTVPVGGEVVFRLIVPGGSQIVVPLPEGTNAGDTVGFDLNAAQIASLPISDIEALLDGRYHVEPGDGE